MRIRAIAAAMFICAASPGLAHADALYGFVVGHSCGQWLALSRERGVGYYSARNWIFGWLSAARYYGKPLRDADEEAISAYFDKYCREHPLDHIPDAAMALVVELSKPN
jgi:hypothetical protein